MSKDQVKIWKENMNMINDELDGSTYTGTFAGQ